MKCEICGDEHELLDPTFKRPDEVFVMPEDERRARVAENDDLCRIRASGTNESDRFFVRCTLAVALRGSEDETMWGVWVEVGAKDFETIWERWSDPDQADTPPMASRLANRIAGYPDTRGLPLSLQLTGPATRPTVVFASEVDHPFALECRRGVTAHRVVQWLEAIR